jgi:hypothetical protein
MTYLFKLARRLAGVVGSVGLSALLLHCSSGTASQVAGSEAPTLVSLSVFPHAVSLAIGDSVQLVAWGRTAAGDSIPVYPTWLVFGGAVTADGWFKAAADGVYQVRANADGLQDSAAVNVVAAAQPVATLTALVANPLTVTLQVGATRQFVVSALWSDGSQTVPPVVWSAAGGSITADGVYTAGQQPGSYRVLCSSPSAGTVDTSTVIVTPAVAAVRIAPDSINLVPGANMSLQFVATMSDSSERIESATWSATGGTVSTAGVYTAGPVAGSFAVTGAIDDGSGNTLSAASRVIVVTAPTALTALAVTPAQADIASGSTLKFAATATWSDSSRATPAVTWSATGGTITTDGLFTAGPAAGQYTVTATQQGGAVNAGAAVTIVAPHVTKLAVTPAASVVAAGASAAFAAAATWSDGQVHPYTVTWSATGGSISSGGMFQAGSVAGNFIIVAACTCGVVDTAHAAVLPAPAVLTSLVMTPSTAALASGATQQFSVTAHWSDSSTTLPPLTWSAAGGAISASGTFVAGNIPGSYHVIAMQQGGTRADTGTVTIAAAIPATIALNVDTVRLYLGKQFQLSATLTDPGHVLSSQAVRYSSTGGSVSANGMYTAPAAPGTYQIVATASNGIADSTVVIVTATRFGIHSDIAWSTDASFRASMIAQAHTMGAGVMRVELLWEYIEYTQGHPDWTVPDDVINSLVADGIEPLIVIDGSPSWANGVTPGQHDDYYLYVPTDPTAFANWVNLYKQFITTAATRYKGKVHFWEIGNEPNADAFWKPGVDLPQYAQWFTAIDGALRAVDPTNQTSSAGLAALPVWYGNDGMSGVAFLQGLYGLGVHPQNVAIHPYSDQNQAPSVHIAGAENFDDIALIHNLMVSNGQGNAGLWVTEWGWNTNKVTEAQQATYLRQSLDLMQSQYPYVSLATYFSEFDTPSVSTSFGVLHADGTAKAALAAYQGFMSH